MARDPPAVRQRREAEGRRPRNIYDVRTSDGQFHELRLNAGFTALKVRIDGAWHQLEPRLPWWAVVLVFLPVVAMAYMGGMVGVLVAAPATSVNRRVARAGRAAPIRILGMLATTGLALAVYFVGSVLLWLAVFGLPGYRVGTCYDGVEPGSIEDIREVDCADPRRGGGRRRRASG